MRKNRALIFYIAAALFIYSAGPVFSSEILNYPSGVYSENIFLTLSEIPTEKDIFYSFIENDVSPGIPYNGGFLLSALPGEARTYYVSFSMGNEIYNFKYLIDKKKPSSPQKKFVSDDSGFGWIFENSGGSTVYYGYDDYKSGETFAWSGETVRSPQNGFVYYYAEDSAGNRSPVELILPEEEASGSGRISLNVKSPVEGVFLNTQLLYIDREGFEWIRYTLNGYDPVESGADYTEPVEIRRYGNVVLKVAAKPLLSDRIITKEINYKVNTKVPLKNIPPSGIYSAGINIESIFGEYNYCLEERSPTADDNLFTDELRINPVYGGVKNTVLRLSDSRDRTAGDYRYFYIIDDRYPANPLITFNSRLPEENILDVKISGPVYSDIYFTTDGSSPGKSSELYEKSFSMEIPQNRNAGSIIVKARAISLNGKPSSIVSKIFTYDTEKPEKPEVYFVKDNETGIYSIDYSIGTDEKLYYYLVPDSGKTEYSFDDFYPVEQEQFFIDVPEGYSGLFNFIFASIDSAGNISDFSEPVNLEINKILPGIPKITFEEGTFAVEEEEKDLNIEYIFEVSKNGNTLFSERGTYEGPVEISENDYKNATLIISLVVTDPNGNMQTVNRKFYLDAEADEKEAVLFSRKTEDIYSGNEVSFFAYPDGINDKLYYYLTEINPEGDNLTTGPVETDGNITVEGEEGVSRDFRLEVFSINEDNGSKSRVSSYEFTIDNEKPSIPGISGIAQGSTVSDRVILTAESDGKSVVFLNAGNNEDVGELFSKSSIIFNKPLKFDVKNGEEKEFYLKIGAGDAAGNSSVNENIFSFKIDKKPPVITSVSLDKDPDNPEETLRLNIEVNESCKFYYEKGAAGARIKTPGPDSDFFTGSLLLETTDSDDGEYIIRVLPVDDAGNRANYPISVMYKINHKKPVNNTGPQININDRFRKVFVSFPNNENRNLYYSIKTSEEPDDYVKYDHPFSVKYTGNEENLNLSYFVSDKSGNNSDLKTEIINLPVAVNRELVEGIKNNSYYNSDLELRAVNRDRILRYEISTDQVFPGKVSVFSPVLPQILPFRIADGESINFVVSVKEFENDDDVIGGAEQILRFTIDKQLPDPPEISGISNGEYYLEDCIASFKPSSDRIFYSVSTDPEAADNYKEFTEPFDISTPKGTFYSYTIKAFTRDFAGNKSSVKSWVITIDKEIIYVSQTGKDYFEGTRSKPYRSINKALEQVKHSDRKTIFVEEGSYILNSPGVIDESVSLYGGFRKGSWHDKSGDSEIIIDSTFPDANPAFYIYGGNLTLENIDLNITDKSSNTVFFVNKGDLSIRNCKIDIDNISNSFIRQDYGRLILNNTEITGRVNSHPLLENKYGNIEINNSVFSFYSENDFSKLLDAENCVNYSISNSEFNISKGRNFTVMSFKNSSVKLRSDRIKINNCSVISTALECIDSKISFDYSRVETLNENRISRAVVAEDSTLSFNGNTIELDALSGVIGFNLTGGESFFASNKISGLKSNDFSYLYMINGGSHQIETNLFSLMPADEVINLRIKNADVDYLNNTVFISAGNSRSYAFKAENDSLARIINNIIINDKGPAGILVYSDLENMLSLKNNCIYGWKSMFAGYYSADDLISLDLLDGIYSEGRFSGNIEEAPSETFEEGSVYRLSDESRCIDSGYDLNNIIKNKKDIDGDQRPNRSINRTATYDIGADEFYSQ